MNTIAFETYVDAAAKRHGWDVSEASEDGEGRMLSSTAHEGLLYVFPEGEMFCIVPTQQPVQKVSLDELPDALRTLRQTDTSPKNFPPLLTERLRAVKIRTVQYRYRLGLERIWEGHCACTGIDVPELLRASHAKPWNVCTDAERVDPYNGFLLEARFDALFDRGLITFEDDGALVVSPQLSPAHCQALGITPELRVHPISPRHLPYLRWHRERVFGSTK